MAQTKGKKAMLTIGVVVAGVAALWYGVFGLKPYSLSAEELTARYAYPVKQQVQLEPLLQDYQQELLVHGQEMLLR